MIVAGFGFNSYATSDSLKNAFEKAGGAAGFIATLEGKVPEMLRCFDKSVIVVPIADAQQQVTPTQSAVSLWTKGIGSVAEATALAAAGPHAVLTVKRVTSDDGRATCAIAKRVSI